MQTDYLFNHLCEAILGYHKDLPILVGIDVQFQPDVCLVRAEKYRLVAGSGETGYEV